MKKHTARRLLTVITAFFMRALSACGATGASGGNYYFVLDTNLISYNDELVRLIFRLSDRQLKQTKE